MMGEVPRMVADDRASFAAWSRQMKYFLRANLMEDEERKKDILLGCTGPATLMKMRDVCLPDDLDDLCYDEIMERMEAEYNPKPVKFVLQMAFREIVQKEGQSFRTFLGELRKSARQCSFENEDYEMLFQLMKGSRDRSTVEALIKKGDSLTLNQAVLALESSETSHKAVSALMGKIEKEEPSACEVFHVREQSRQGQWRRERSSREPSPNRSCFRCGGWHDESTCVWKNRECFRCDKMGHMARMCPTRKSEKREYREERYEKSERQQHPQQSENTIYKNKKRPYKKPGQSVNHVEADEDRSSEKQAVSKPESKSENRSLLFEPGFEYLRVQNLSCEGEEQDAIQTEIFVEGQPLVMQVDSGAPCSVVSMEEYVRMFPHKQLQPFDTPVKSWGARASEYRCRGVISVEVKYGDHQMKQLPLLVMEQSGPALLGLSWFKPLGLGICGVQEQLEKPTAGAEQDQRVTQRRCRRRFRRRGRRGGVRSHKPEESKEEEPLQSVNHVRVSTVMPQKVSQKVSAVVWPPLGARAGRTQHAQLGARVERVQEQQQQQRGERGEQEEQGEPKEQQLPQQVLEPPTQERWYDDIFWSEL